MDGTTTTTTGGGAEPQLAPDAPTTEQPQLVSTAVGDQCSNCGARMAGDQRYCVECGQRRGKARYSLAGSEGGAGRGGMASYATRPRRTLSGNSALISGIAVLLIAMGVGILIGRTSNGSTPRSAVQIVTVPGAGAPAATATPTTSSTAPSTSSSSSSSSSKGSKATKATAKNPTAALQAKLPAKAKVIPKALKSKVAKVGGACSSGPGCQNGKFTGTFFGGG